MDFLWSEEQEQIRDAVERACAPFDADYWLRKDHEGGFPHDFPCRRSSAARAWASARRR
jgi:acyl-CoA dehydrogenase